jgi:hypothetical protein
VLARVVLPRYEVRIPLSLSAMVFGLCLLLCQWAQGGRVIPFEYRDGLIWVKVRAEGQREDLHFLLDSGAGASVLSLDAAGKLKVKLGSASRVQRVGAAAVAYRVRDFHAQVGSISLGSNPWALDLRETSALCSRPIDGLIGQDFFRDRIVQIDFKAGQIRLLEKAEFGKHCAVVPLKRHRDSMCVAASVNGGKEKWVRLDTGCDDGLHWVSGANNGGEVEATLQLGAERLAQVPTTMHARELFPDEAGLLGNAVLSNYIVTIDAVAGRMLLAKG